MAAGEHHQWHSWRGNRQQGRLLRPERLAMPHSPRIRLLRTLVLMFAVAEWCWSMLGVARFDAVLMITFAWASTIVRRMMTEPSVGTEIAQWPSDVTAAVAAGQLLWVLLPWLRAADPQSWFWLPVAVPTSFWVVGSAVAVCWPLQPFFARFCSGETPPANGAAIVREWDVAVLSGSFFLISGSLVFAVVACASSAAMLVAGAVSARDADLRAGYLQASTVS
jgi:hypothetical protein